MGDEMSSLPIGAEPKNIGKVVTIQVFRRVTGDIDTIRPETLEKHVGILQSYYDDKRGFIFCLVGGSAQITLHPNQYVEIFPYNP